MLLSEQSQLAAEQRVRARRRVAMPPLAARRSLPHAQPARHFRPSQVRSQRAREAEELQQLRQAARSSHAQLQSLQSVHERSLAERQRLREALARLSDHNISLRCSLRALDPAAAAALPLPQPLPAGGGSAWRESAVERAGGSSGMRVASAPGAVPPLLRSSWPSALGGAGGVAGAGGAAWAGASPVRHSAPSELSADGSVLRAMEDAKVRGAACSAGGGCCASCTQAPPPAPATGALAVCARPAAVAPAARTRALPAAGRLERVGAWLPLPPCRARARSAPPQSAAQVQAPAPEDWRQRAVQVATGGAVEEGGAGVGSAQDAARVPEVVGAASASPRSEGEGEGGASLAPAQQAAE